MMKFSNTGDLSISFQSNRSFTVLWNWLLHYPSSHCISLIRLLTNLTNLQTSTAALVMCTRTPCRAQGTSGTDVGNDCPLPMTSKVSPYSKRKLERPVWSRHAERSEGSSNSICAAGKLQTFTHNSLQWPNPFVLMFSAGCSHNFHERQETKSVETTKLQENRLWTTYSWYMNGIMVG